MSFKVVAIGDSITAKTGSWADRIGAEKRAEGGHLVVDAAPKGFADTPAPDETTVIALGTNDANCLGGLFGFGRRLLSKRAHLALLIRRATPLGPNCVDVAMERRGSARVEVSGNCVAVLYEVGDDSDGFLVVSSAGRSKTVPLSSRMTWGGFVRTKRQQRRAPGVVLLEGLGDGPHVVTVRHSSKATQTITVIGSDARSSSVVVADMYARSDKGWADGKGSEKRTAVLNSMWRRNVQMAQAVNRRVEIWPWSEVIMPQHLADDGLHLNADGDAALAHDWRLRWG